MPAVDKNEKDFILGYKRNEAEENLNDQEKKELQKYAAELSKDLESAEIFGKEREETYNALMNYQVCYLCEEHFRNAYNKQKATVEGLLKKPYEGNDKKKQEEYLSSFSEAKARMNVLEAKYNNFHNDKMEMEEIKENERDDVPLLKKYEGAIYDRLAERGKGDTIAQSPKYGPTVQQQNSPKKR